MIGCPRCSKENQDHYKFCLGCGAELTSPAKPGGDIAVMKTMMADSSSLSRPSGGTPSPYGVPGQGPMPPGPMGPAPGPMGPAPGMAPMPGMGPRPPGPMGPGPMPPGPMPPPGPMGGPMPGGPMGGPLGGPRRGGSRRHCRTG